MPAGMPQTAEYRSGCCCFAGEPVRLYVPGFQPKSVIAGLGWNPFFFTEAAPADEWRGNTDYPKNLQKWGV